VDAASAATATALARLASTDVRRGPRLSITARFPGGEITWTVPAGGCFVVVTVPFPVDDVLLEKSAHEYGVLWTPMSHFYDGDTPIHALRLSCSSVTPAQIDTALDRLAALIRDELVLSVGPELDL
jgi:(S)-3,5-dihydroxyphenylglycine transaminase